MERTIKPRIIIDKEAWKDIVIEDTFTYPDEVKDLASFLDREKMMRYVNEHPYRLYHYWVDNVEFTVDCKGSAYLIAKHMTAKGAATEDVDIAIDIGHQLQHFYGKMSACSKRAFGGNWLALGGVLAAKQDELLDLFGRLYTLDEVYRIVIEDWGYNIARETIRTFYSRNIQTIEKLRDQYQSDFSDVALTKKRSRLDKLSVMFFTYYNKWSKDNRLEYSRELRAILEHIRKEVEGDNINLNIQGQINVDMTIEANKTLYDTYKRIPVNNLILGMVAAKKGIDPTKLMAQLTSSYYSAMTGYGGKYDAETQLIHPVDLTYNWNEINMKHRGDKKNDLIEEAKLVTTAGTQEKDAKLMTTKKKLLAILDNDREENNKRRLK
jgi:hypothetical protein